MNVNPLSLPTPHGFLISNGKQTAIASADRIDTTLPSLIVSNGEAFGIAILDQPAQIALKEFDTKEWRDQHRITPRERRQWWPNTTSFYIYRLKSWDAFDGVKLYEDGELIDEPKLTAAQWKLVSESRELPKQITLIQNAVSITDRKEFVINKAALSDELLEILAATYNQEIVTAKEAKEIIPVYSLALIRQPRMRVSKKNIIAEATDEIKEVSKADKTEGNKMPYAIVRRDGEFCVINSETEDVEKCHDTQEDAEAHLTALNLNVMVDEDEMVEDGEGASDKPKKPKPKPRHTKKEASTKDTSADDAQTDNNGYTEPVEADDDTGVVIEFTVPDEVDEPDEPDEDLETEEEPVAAEIEPETKKTFLDGLRSMYKGLTDFFTFIDSEDEEAAQFDKEFSTKAGFTQKLVAGELWHYTWSTNAFEDRDKEIFSTKGLEEYVAANEKNKNKGAFNLWHINEEDGNFNTDFAIKKWQGVIGRFLVEAGPYTRDEKGRAARKFFKKFAAGHPEIAPEGWGCSPEFKYLPEERETGVYKNIWITRTSTLPKMAAANLWTQTRQYKRGANKMALTDDQYRNAVEMFGGDFVKRMMNEGQAKTAELEAAGVAHKEVKETGEGEVVKETAVDTEAEVPEVSESVEEPEVGDDALVDGPPTPTVNKIEFTKDQFDALAANVAEHVRIDQSSVLEAMAIMAEGVKNMEARIKAIEAKDDAKARAEVPTFTFGLQRASEAEQTTVADDDDLKSKKPAGDVPNLENVTPATFFKT